MAFKASLSSGVDCMTNRDFQNRLVDLLRDGWTVLAETERFVHQVQRSFRLENLRSGSEGWEAAKVFTLNHWLDAFWADSWPDEWPAPSFTRWHILRECFEESPPPEPLSRDAGLIQLVDRSFELCLRYGIDPGRGEGANRLIEWRREIWRVFSAELQRAGFFHPAQLPEKIMKILPKSPKLPSRMVFAGFEFAGDREKQLLRELQERTGAEVIPLPGEDARPEALVYPDPDQEITGLMENLLMSAREFAPHEIAVVLLDPQLYGPAVSNHLEDLLGAPLSGDLAAYNLSPDRNLSDQPLFHAGLLPLRFAIGGEMRRDLFAFLRSPYYGLFSRWNRNLSFWDKIWRDSGIEGGLEGLLGAVRGRAGEIFPREGDEIRDGIAPFRRQGRRPVSHWAGGLRRIWSDFRFPVLANELDRISWGNLDGMLLQFERAFVGTDIDASEFMELLSAAASGIAVERSGLEDGGFQILGGLDIRGLAFRKVFIPGLLSGVLPRPVRPLPLLSSHERRKVLGGTQESEFAFGRYIYRNFCASAPEIVLSRPAMGADGEMTLPSPFWIAEEDKTVRSVIPWKDRLPAMQRARWVRQSISGTAPERASGKEGDGAQEERSARVVFDRGHFRMRPLPITEPISVSALQSALLCPAQFFFAHILGLQELAEFEGRISPLERGQKVHEIVASFVSRSIRRMREGEDFDFSFEALAALLKETVLEKLEPELSATVWQVEMERLLGKADYPGLLLRWLGEEWKKILEGWRWTAVESGFKQLELQGCRVAVKGRLDRIDSHPEHGIICWDYKTGSVPKRKDITEENTQPQLPAYLLALSRGIVQGMAKGEDKCGAGYIEMSSPGNMKHLLLFDPAEENGPFLSGWEIGASEALNRILEGDISPIWLEENRPCEERCAFRVICGSP
jgi:RecB family exonuclease